MKALAHMTRICLFLSAGMLAWAQAISTSQIQGTVQDSTGLAVPAAEVKVTHTDTGAVRTVTTGADGGYVLTNLPIGPYQLEVSKEGFAKYVQKGIVLQVAANPTVDVTLKVGSVSEQVMVQADAAMVETQATGVGAVIENQRILELPLNGRNVTDLISMAGAAVQIAHEPQPPALAHEIHDQPCGLLPLLDAAVDAALAEQAAGVEVAAQVPQVAVDIGVLHRAVDSRRVVAGERHRPYDGGCDRVGPLLRIPRDGRGLDDADDRGAWRPPGIRRVRFPRSRRRTGRHAPGARLRRSGRTRQLSGGATSFGLHRDRQRPCPHQVRRRPGTPGWRSRRDWQPALWKSLVSLSSIVQINVDQ